MAEKINFMFWLSNIFYKTDFRIQFLLKVLDLIFKLMTRKGSVQRLPWIRNHFDWGLNIEYRSIHEYIVKKNA
jgi:hypothetical protein